MAGLGLSAVTMTLRRQFSDVVQMSTEELQSLMESEGDKIAVLDTRPEEEFKVSHVKGAIRIDPTLQSWQDLSAAAPDINVKEKAIFYCSVGYRSSAVVARLQRHKPDSGKTPQLFNLEGSLFKWANEEREMVNCQNEPTPYCHPYSAFWGLLLNSQLRKREPERKANI